MSPPPLQIFYPNGGTQAVQMYVYQGSIPVLWDGAVTFSGSISIGAVTGTKTNNNAAPSTDNLGVLPALCNTSAPSYTDGRLVLLSVTTTGALRVSATIDTTGLATSAKQDTGNTSLSSIDGKTPALGQALAAASVPVVLTAAQIITLTPPAAITNYANETGGNLASIKAKTDNIPALGQALAAASVPVVLTAAQITTLTPPAAITNYANETGGNLAAAKADLDTLAAIVSSARAAVNPIPGSAGVAGGSGTISTTTQRVVIATDQPAVSVTSGKTIKVAVFNTNAATDVVAAVTSKRIKVIAVKLTTVSTTQATIGFFSNGTGGTRIDETTLQAPTGASVGYIETISAPDFLFATVAGEKLTLDPNSQTMIGRVTYFDDDAS